MPSKTFEIPTLTGEADVEAATTALRQLQGVRSVEVHADRKGMTVEWDAPATWDEMTRTLETLGYTPDV